MHIGQGFAQGQKAGEQAHTLTISELPAHAHAAVGTSNTTDSADPTNNTWANGASFGIYHNQANTGMDPGSVLAAGGSQAHSNMAPYLGINFVIALQGIFPSRN